MFWLRNKKIIFSYALLSGGLFTYQSFHIVSYVFVYVGALFPSKQFFSHAGTFSRLSGVLNQYLAEELCSKELVDPLFTEKPQKGTLTNSEDPEEMSQVK